MTVDLLLDYGYRFLFVVLVTVWVAAALYPRARTPGMPPRPTIEIRDKKEVLAEIERESQMQKKQYDFRDDAQQIMQMLKKRYKSKDGLRKAKNVVDHIYQMYENKCKKCTK